MNFISFIKMVAAGNDFVLIDRAENNNTRFSKELIQKICDRKTGVGADGLMILQSHSGEELNIEFYNSDGSYGALCGNGSRCVIKYIRDKRSLNKGKVYFVFNGKQYHGFIDDSGTPVFNLQKPLKIDLNKVIEFDGIHVTGDFIDLNVPHFVININENSGLFSSNTNIDNVDVLRIGRKIRFAKEFAPVGVNVNFIDPGDENISVRTYERGVEYETLSCGTGSVASAISAFLHRDIKPPVNILTKSGEKLVVNFKYENNIFTNITLKGNAKIVFHGKFILN